MYISTASFTSFLFLTLSTFQIAVNATAVDSVVNKVRELAPRQSSTSTVSCQEYATVANLSTISTNSTFRAAFQQNSGFGTNHASGILDGATKQLANLINDQALNQQCGNLTEIAVAEAPKNFSMGIVGPFTIKDVGSGAERIGSGMVMLVSIAMMVIATAVFL